MLTCTMRYNQLCCDKIHYSAGTVSFDLRCRTGVKGLAQGTTDATALRRLSRNLNVPFALARLLYTRPF